MNQTWWVDPAELDPDQLAVHALPISENQLIYGPPGSGKTNLLLLKGSEFVAAGTPKVLFIVLNRGLKEFIAAGSANYTFDSENVRTFRGWMMHFLGKEKVPFHLTDNYKKDTKSLIRLCQNQIEQKQYQGIYDAVIIDEAQDCLPEEVELFAKLGRVLFVATDHRQKIYSTPSVLELWHEIIPESNRHHLRYHYRNGQKICKLADEIIRVQPGSQISPTSKYDERKYPSIVRVNRQPSLQLQISQVVSSIPGELRAYPGEFVGILCPNQQVITDAADLLRESVLANQVQYHVNEGDGYDSFDPEKRIILIKIHSGKGLEFRTLHLLETNQIAHLSNTENVAFTAVTRAKTSLNVYHSGSLPSFLTSALNSLEPPTPKTDISKLFKKKDVD